MNYIATSLGVSILFAEGQDVSWFFDMALAKGGTISIKKVDD